MLCRTCKCDLGSDDVKAHLHSNWHIYNLKRTLNGLPPVSKDVYSQKEAQFHMLDGSNNVKHSESFYCKVCKKTFKTLKAYEGHNTSQQHINRTKYFESTAAINSDEHVKESCEDGKESSDEGLSEAGSSYSETTDQFSYPLPVGSCFFCHATYEDKPDAIKCVLAHMSEKHNFNLPFVDKLVDAKGLLENLGRLVGEEFACLGCGRQFFGRRQGRHKKSAAELRKEALGAVRRHMIDKQHNFLYTGVEDPVVVALAIAEAGADEDESLLPPIARVGGELYSTYYNGDRANSTLVLPGPDDKFVAEETYEVRLPTGGVIGNRRYYKTVFRQNPNAILELPSSGQQHQAALAWKTHCGCKALMHMDENEVAKIRSKEDRGNRLLNQRKSRQDLKLGIRGNTVLAKHFRAAQ